MQKMCFKEGGVLVEKSCRRVHTACLVMPTSTDDSVFSVYATRKMVEKHHIFFSKIKMNIF